MELGIGAMHEFDDPHVAREDQPHFLFEFLERKSFPYRKFASRGKIAVRASSTR